MCNLDHLIAQVIENEDINLLVNYFGINDFNQGYKFGPHEHNSVEVNFIKSGSCKMIIGSECLHFKENDCMIIYPNTPHSFFTDANRSCSMVQLDFNINNFPVLDMEYKLEEELVFLYEILTNTRQYIKTFDSKNLSCCIERIIEEKKQKPYSGDTLIKIYFCELFIIISRQIMSTLSGVISPSNSYVIKALKFINARYNENINLEIIADQCGITSRYLRKLFKEQIGLSLIDYITAVRINKAKELVGNKSLNMTEIAYSVGYATSQYFNKMFKNNVGMNPTEYRKFLFRKV